MNLLGEEPGQSHFQIIQMEMTYFQHVRNCFSRKASQKMDVKFGDFKREVIEDVYAFNFANYIKANTLTKTRLYIMTKKLSLSQLIKSMNSTVNVTDRDEGSNNSFLDFIYSDRTIR